MIGIYCVKKINKKRNNTIAYCPHRDLQVCSLTASVCLQLCSLWRCVVPEHFLHPLQEALSSEQPLSSWQLPVYFLAMWICILYKWNHVTCGLVCLVSFT